jgi:hypothetical protein
MRRTLILLGVFVLLSGCSQGPVARLPGQTDAPADFPADPFPGATGARFKVLPSESMVQIKVFRAGRLARLGHNHVISSRYLGGEVLVSDDLAQSRASLYLPVASMVVDDPLFRQEAGEGFEYPLSEQDREATRANMLGERLLNAVSHPYVYIRVLGLQEAEEGLSATVELTVLDKQLSRQVPVEFSRTACAMSVRSSFELRHAEIGLEAFSVLGGALQVQDMIQVEVDVLGKSRSPDCTG